MNRRVLRALLTLSDLHRMKEAGVDDPNATYARHGAALQAFRGDEDELLYEDIAARICEAGETIIDDPDGAIALEKARVRT